MGKVLDVHANVLSLEAAPAASRSGAQTIHTGVDTQRLGGRAKLVVSGSNVSGTTPTYDAKIQEGDTLGGAYTDLLDLDGVALHTTQGARKIRVYFDVLANRSKQRQGTFDLSVQVKHLHGHDLLSAKSQHLMYQRGSASAGIADRLQSILMAVIHDFPQQEFRPSADDRQQVVEVVRDPPGQLADRLHLLRAS